MNLREPSTIGVYTLFLTFGCLGASSLLAQDGPHQGDVQSQPEAAGVTTHYPAPPKLDTVFEISLPENADLFVDGYKTHSKGAVRTFSPPALPALAKGGTYSYTFKIVTRAGDTKTTIEKVIKFAPGGTISIDFTVGASLRYAASSRRAPLFTSLPIYQDSYPPGTTQESMGTYMQQDNGIPAPDSQSIQIPAQSPGGL